MGKKEDIISARQSIVAQNRELESQIRSIRIAKKELEAKMNDYRIQENELIRQMQNNNNEFFDLGTELEKITGLKRLKQLK